MTLLLVSSFLTDDQGLAYGLLLLATASLGAGFGFTVPALDTGVKLPTVYAFAAIVAALMGGWSFVARRRPSPAALHPQLGHGAR